MPHTWPPPESRDVGVLSDPVLYGEMLRIAFDKDTIGVADLQRELGPRLRGQHLLQMQQSQRVAQQLLSEARRYRWLTVEGGGSRQTMANSRLTEAGKTALDQFTEDRRAFLRTLVVSMHSTFVIPGWLVDHLWRINPSGQGEVILPAPPAAWKPRSQPWAEAPWTADLETQSQTAAARARAASVSAFPVEDCAWLGEVRRAWEYLSTRQPRGKREEDKPARYSPRLRLAQAMRRATLRLLFDRVLPGQSNSDYAGLKSPFYLASFRVWCTRLLELELIFYTDAHPDVEGRLVFPVSVFREDVTSEQYESLDGIRRFDGRLLCLHQPKWSQWRERFWQALVEVHRSIAQRVRARYVSLLDVRDEVCRQLRLSATRFEEFLEQALEETPPAACPWYLSAETDLREDLRSGPGLLRRPVYIRRVPHTLIAANQLTGAERSRL